MNTSPNKRAITVGVFVVLGLVFLTAGVLVIGNIHQTFTRKLRVTSLFDDVNGLQKGSNIWFSGVKIGTVKQVDFFGVSQVKVIMNIDREAQPYIRKDAKVKISTEEVRKLAKNQSWENWSEMRRASARVSRMRVTSALSSTICRIRFGHETIVLQS